MDIGNRHFEEEDGEGEVEEQEESFRPRQLPPDLPKSLDDRRAVRSYVGETEMYDAWQGMVSIPFALGCLCLTNAGAQGSLSTYQIRFRPPP